MNNRAIIFLLAIFILIASSGVGGYFTGLKKADKSAELGELRDKNLRQERLIEEMEWLGSFKTCEGVVAPINSRPGYSRYLSPSGLTFVFKNSILIGDKMEEVILEDKPCLPVSDKHEIKLQLKSNPEISQLIVYGVLEEDTTPNEYAVRSGLAEEIQLFQIDEMKKVKRYSKVIQRNALPVNSFAIDEESDDLRVITFNDDPKTIAYISYRENKLFGDDIDEFISSIEMIK